MRAAAWLCAVVLFSGASAVSQDFFGWSSGTDTHRDIKGKPKLVRMEREIPGGSRQLEDQTDYQPDGKISERRVWREDGTLSVHEVFEYDDKGHPTKIVSTDDKGKVVRTRLFRRTDPDTEEETQQAGDAVPATRTIRKFDPRGRMVEMDEAEGDRIRFSATMRYDDQDRPVEARLHMKGGVAMAQDQTGFAQPGEGTMRVEIAYHGDNKTILTMRGPDDKILLQVESNEDAAGQDIAQVLFSAGSARDPATTTQVSAPDEHGNWTRQTVLKRNASTQVAEPVAIVHRTITYY